jgi:hypothetical protein
VRGGYGIFFEHTNGNEGNTESLENSPPLASVPQILHVQDYTNINSGSGGGVFPLGVVAIPTKAQWPYMQQWHFDVQQQVARNTVATISYVGSKGTHLTRESNLNQLFPLSGANPYNPGEPIITDSTSPSFNTDCTNPNSPVVNGVSLAPASDAAIHVGVAACGLVTAPLRPFLGYGTITHLEEKASSHYHAMQTSLRRNVGQLTVSAAYTWSHSIDDSSDRGDSSFVNAYNFAANRASSNFDQRHIFNFSYVWDVPLFRSSGIGHTLLGGWQLSGIASVESGTPFSAVFNTDNAGVANGVAGAGARPDQIGNPRSGPFPAPDSGFARAFYNINAFTAPRGLTFGDVGRNTLNNPRHTNFDMALFKHFAIKESLAFEFRAEAYNVFNHTEWGNIAASAGSAGGSGNNTLGNPGFLQVSSAHNPRILQLGAKLLF